MDPKELRGRELAAWALGTLGYDGEPMKDLGQISKAVFWMAAEIERLCAEPTGKRIELIDPKVYSEQAARDAKTLDEITEVVRTKSFISYEMMADLLARSGRNIIP